MNVYRNDHLYDHGAPFYIVCFKTMHKSIPLILLKIALEKCVFYCMKKAQNFIKIQYHFIFRVARIYFRFNVTFMCNQRENENCPQLYEHSC